MKAKPTHENPAINDTAFIDTMILRNIILSKWQFVAASTVAFILLLASSGRAEEVQARNARKKQALIEQCISQMNDPEGPGRSMSFDMLRNLGPDADAAVPALSEALKHKDSYIRIQSAYTLWKIAHRASAIQILSTELNEKANEVSDRAMAAEALGLIGGFAKAALPTLVEATKDQDAQLRVNAAWALWAVDKQSELAKPVLIDALKNDDLKVSSTAVWALGEIGFDEPGLTALGEAISESETFVAQRALPALAKALNSNGAGIRRKTISVMSLMSGTISAVGDRDSGAQAAIMALIKTKKDDEDPAIRAAAAEVLKKIDPEVVAKVVAGEGARVVAEAANKTHPLDLEDVAKPFITALANQNVAEALKYVIPKERDEFNEELKKGIPPWPKDPQVQIERRENGTRAGVTILNAQQPASGPPDGFNMEFSNGKWWIVK